MTKNYNWLPELDDTVPKEAYGYAVTSYSIAYEAWRRGLNISFENIYNSKGLFIPRYIISSKDKKIRFIDSRPHVVSKEAIKICSNKQLTREMLGKKYISVPKGKVLKSLEYAQIKRSISDLRFPLVIKPLHSTDGNGVITGIESLEELLNNLDYLNKKLNYEHIIVEEFISGEVYRAFVIGDKVVGAYRRLPPHVIGDGRKTIKQLLKEMNDIREKIPSTYDTRLRINDEVKRELKKQGHLFQSVPEKDELVRLKTKNNVLSSGDPIDATDDLPEDFKKNLVKAVEAIPGLIQAGVDVIYNKRTEEYAILKIISKPSIKNHLFPLKGKSRNIPKAIIDYYFPETIGKYLSDTTPKYFFDYLFVKEYLQNNRVKKFTLPDHPYEPNLISKLIKFESDMDLNKVKRMIRKKFHKFKFNGEMNLSNENKYEIIVAGNYQDVERFIDSLKEKKYIKNVEDENFFGGVRIGFTFNYKQMENSKVLLKEKDRKIKELEKRIKQIENSKSWRLTAPLRTIVSKIKKYN